MQLNAFRFDAQCSDSMLKEVHMAMKLIRKNETIALDDAKLYDTEFQHCEFVYRGGNPPVLVGNTFVNCQWLFEDEAAQTVDFLKALHHGGLETLVLATLGIAADKTPFGEPLGRA